MRVSLPVRFQKPSYLIKGTSLAEDAADVDEELTLKVGADITTTAGPVTLRDIMKRLASLHNMNVSWASDVDQYVYVDVFLGCRGMQFQNCIQENHI